MWLFVGALRTPSSGEFRRLRIVEALSHKLRNGRSGTAFRLQFVDAKDGFIFTKSVLRVQAKQR